MTFREKDKRYVESKKIIKHRSDNERTSNPITVVTLHGKSENFEDTDIESSEKLPNLHFSIYGTCNQDVYV